MKMSIYLFCSGCGKRPIPQESFGYPAQTRRILDVDNAKC